MHLDEDITGWITITSWQYDKCFIYLFWAYEKTIKLNTYQFLDYFALSIWLKCLSSPHYLIPLWQLSTEPKIAQNSLMYAICRQLTIIHFELISLFLCSYTCRRRTRNKKDDVSTCLRRADKEIWEYFFTSLLFLTQWKCLFNRVKYALWTHKNVDLFLNYLTGYI